MVIGRFIGFNLHVLQCSTWRRLSRRPFFPRFPLTCLVYSRAGMAADAGVAAKFFMDAKRTLREAVEEVRKTILKRGLDVLTPYPVGDLAGFRGLEPAAALNRLRTFRIQSRNLI